MDAGNHRVKYSQITVAANGRSHQLSYFDRPGEGRTILYVHGLGCSKTDFLGMTNEPPLDAFRILSYDHPGCGDSPYSVKMDIDSLVRVLEAFVDAVKLNKFLLAGGSMGGLIALLYAERHPSRITGFVNIEGNLAPEDCMFSRLVVPHDYAHFERVVLPEIKSSLAARRKVIGFLKHLEVLERANPRAYYANSFQTVEYSDRGHLVDRFLALPLPKYFVYGSENRHLSYLPRLRHSDCKVIEVPHADHYVFYDNPKDLAAALADVP